MDTEDKFKASFKYFKKRNPTPSLENVIDFDSSNVDQIFPLKLRQPDSPPIAGLTPFDTWSAFGLKKFPGFYFIRNPFTASGQKYWTHRCLYDFPSKPNVCNLDAHMSLEKHRNIWDVSQSQRRLQCEPRSKGAQRSKGEQKSPIDQLRWVTLGYHHNWDTKHYIPDHASPFPTDLGYLSRYVVEASGIAAGEASVYRPQAAIINYYHMDSTLAGHTDHSEFDLESPLLSASFGQSAIFLVGGTTKSTEPVAMFLRSGDICIMADQSRLAYHAVPKVLSEHEGELPPCLRHDVEGESVVKEQSLPPADGGVQDPHQEPNHKVLKTDHMTQVPGRCEATSQCSDSENIVTNTTTTGGCVLQDLTVTGSITANSGPSDVVTSVPLLPVTLSEDNLSSCISQINNYIKHRMDNIDFVTFGEYLKTARLNMNVRQVFKNGQSFEDVQVCAESKVES